MRLFVGIICTLLLSTTLAAENHVIFAVEEMFKRTIGTKSPVFSGSTVNVRLVKLKNNEKLSLYRCGPKCNTAKHISSWSTNSTNIGVLNSITLTEGGEFYFWVQQKLKTGEVGPVQITTTNKQAGFYMIEFESGSKVEINIISPNKSLKSGTPKTGAP